MSKNEIAQRPPAEGQDLSTFPAKNVGGTLWRAHAANLEAWFFASDEFGRFNLSTPDGSCYAATDPETAVRERLADILVLSGQTVTSAQADAFVVSELSVDTTVRCADLGDSRAARHGVIRELCTMTDYTVSRAWARAFHQTGLGGIVYPSRFTTGAATAVCFFGSAGSGEGDVTGRVGGAEACAAAGIEVLLMPSSRGVEFATPPQVAAPPHARVRD